MRIIGPPTQSWPLVADRVAGILGAAPLFCDAMLPALWDAAVSLTIDPVGAIAQSLKETAYGRFGGKVVPDACNTCGLKIRVLGMYGAPTAGDEPLAHAIFPNWEVGALAQVQHLRAYAGWPVDGLIVDPRYTLVAGQRCENFEDLGGKWAPSPTYGTELVALARRMQV